MDTHFARIVGLLCAAAGCGGSTGLSPITYPLSARGIEAAPFVANGWTVTIEEARVGFGPLYLCASVAASSELCETAVAEFAAIGVVDAARAESQPLGSVNGFDGTVRSALYDFGFSWPDERDPHALSGAPDGHSARMLVVARKAGRTLRVRADLDVVPQQARARAVQARLEETPQRSTLRLDIAFPVADWWGHVDFEALALSASDDIALPALSDIGAADPSAPPDVRAGVAARSALLGAMTSVDRPILTWTTQ